MIRHRDKVHCWVAFMGDDDLEVADQEVAEICRVVHG